MAEEIVSEELKQKARHRFECYVVGTRPGFGRHIGRRIKISQLSVSLRSLMATAICEVVVEKDMLDIAHGTLHDGCSAYLIDMCTALPYIILGLAQEKARGFSAPSKFAMAPFAPSQRLDVTYHNPAWLGSQLRITCNSVANDGSKLTVRGEIWDIGKDNIIATGTHMKIMPKKPPLAAHLKL